MDLTQFSPNFIIPKGSQVVLKKDLEILGPSTQSDGTHICKRAGNVGVVVEAPLTNDRTYVVRFADGLCVLAKKTDLALRRSDAPEESLPEREIEAYRPWVIYRLRAGSKSFGLANENSDDDERGIFLPPADWHWSLQPLPEQIEYKQTADGRILDHNAKEGDLDVCWWELEKFLKLALKANPNVLEALYVEEKDVLFCDELGRRLREMRGAFLSKYVFQTYSGYVLSQFRKMKRDVEREGTHRPKHAMHLIRLLYSGIEALRGNGILVDVGQYREELLAIKTQGRPFQEIYDRALKLNDEFQAEYVRTVLPERPDVEAVDRFLMDARRSRV